MAEQTLNTVESQAKDEALSETINKRRGSTSFISNRTPTIEDAEDILQDVLRLVQVRPSRILLTWLYRVARNKITDWYRKMKPDRLDDISFKGSDEDEALLLSDIIPSMETSADKQLLLKLISSISGYIRRIAGEPTRSVCTSRNRWKKRKEIAELTDTGIKTVISRKRYAVLYLQERLRSLYIELLNN